MTFTEPINALALPKQRRTVGLDGAWRAIALALGGAAASRLSATLGMPTSRDTLLRGLRRLGGEVTPADPVVVGIDVSVWARHLELTRARALHPN